LLYQYESVPVHEEELAVHEHPFAGVVHAVLVPYVEHADAVPVHAPELVHVQPGALVELQLACAYVEQAFVVPIQTLESPEHGSVGQTYDEAGFVPEQHESLAVLPPLSLHKTVLVCVIPDEHFVGLQALVYQTYGPFEQAGHSLVHTVVGLAPTYVIQSKSSAGSPSALPF